MFLQIYITILGVRFARTNDFLVKILTCIAIFLKFKPLKVQQSEITLIFIPNLLCRFLQTNCCLQTYQHFIDENRITYLFEQEGLGEESGTLPVRPGKRDPGKRSLGQHNPDK